MRVTPLRTELMVGRCLYQRNTRNSQQIRQLTELNLHSYMGRQSLVQNPSLSLFHTCPRAAPRSVPSSVDNLTTINHITQPLHLNPNPDFLSPTLIDEGTSMSPSHQPNPTLEPPASLAVPRIFLLPLVHSPSHPLQLSHLGISKRERDRGERQKQTRNMGSWRLSCSVPQPLTMLDRNLSRFPSADSRLPLHFSIQLCKGTCTPGEPGPFPQQGASLVQWGHITDEGTSWDP